MTKKKLTEYEKELIGVILDLEKAQTIRANNVANALGAGSADVDDLIPFWRLKSALKLEDTGDSATDIICGYVSGEYTLEEVFEVVELCLNVNYAGLTEWWLSRE